MNIGNRRADLILMAAATLALIGLIELFGISLKSQWYALPIAALCLIPSEKLLASHPRLRLMRRTIAFAILGAFTFAQLSLCAYFVANWMSLFYLYWQEPVRSADVEHNLLLSPPILILPCLISLSFLWIMWLLWTDSPQLGQRPSRSQRRRAVLFLLVLLAAVPVTGGVFWFYSSAIQRTTAPF
ncbi:hypothetical protein DK847_15410 [Aestuariivirga litoralis]|uniref:Uncharacterized protein n=1 Tax=Aestuariivirga litoralis TaxID=2650924 RepID=A0A2W2ATY5_9HYPH|nr:hypothetical protein [Aestuariivirga litoralis]PZF76030.1 hypothetical protein DK847_15410 [Aestuariivirga litoralis]